MKKSPILPMLALSFLTACGNIGPDGTITSIQTKKAKQADFTIGDTPDDFYTKFYIYGHDNDMNFIEESYDLHGDKLAKKTNENVAKWFFNENEFPYPDQETTNMVTKEIDKFRNFLIVKMPNFAQALKEPRQTSPTTEPSAP